MLGLFLFGIIKVHHRQRATRKLIALFYICQYLR
nr:MAG TPA: hypothetical protein [Caudoviricetes sp.]